MVLTSVLFIWPHEMLRLQKNFTSAGLKLVYAFVWQGEFLKAPNVYNALNTFGSQMIPVLNRFVNVLYLLPTKLPGWDFSGFQARISRITHFQDGEKVYARSYHCTIVPSWTKKRSPSKCLRTLHGRKRRGV